jgi:hypothetical protein
MTRCLIAASHLEPVSQAKAGKKYQRKAREALKQCTCVLQQAIVGTARRQLEGGTPAGPFHAGPGYGSARWFV